jgi:hypothetical protein
VLPVTSVELDAGLAVVVTLQAASDTPTVQEAAASTTVRRWFIISSFRPVPASLRRGGAHGPEWLGFAVRWDCWW